MAEKLFFGEITSPNNTYSADLHVGSVFTSSYTGVITSLRVLTSVAGNVKVNLYQGSDTSATLLSAVDTDQAVSIGTNTIVLPSAVAVTQGQQYFIGGNSDTVGALTRVSSSTATRLLLSSTYSTFTAPATLAGYSSVVTLASCLAAYGYEPPTISATTNDVVYDGMTGVTLTVTDAMPTQGSGKLELVDNATYGSGTVFETQTITSWADDSIEFTVSKGSLSTGAVYAFLTTDAGQINSVGFPLTLISSTVYKWIQRSDGSLSAYPHAVVLV